MKKMNIQKGMQRLTALMLSAAFCLNILPPMTVRAAQGAAYYTVLNTRLGAQASASTGTASSIYFDLADGPDLQFSKLSGYNGSAGAGVPTLKHTTTQNGTVNTSGIGWSDAVYVNLHEIEGRAGERLYAIPPLQGKEAHFGTELSSDGDKPKLPWRTAGEPENPLPDYPGYTFSGWDRIKPINNISGNEGSGVSVLEASYPYDRHTVYRAAWTANATTFKLTVKHQIKIPDHTGTEQIYYLEQPTAQELAADTVVSKQFLALAGYRLVGSEIKGKLNNSLISDDTKKVAKKNGASDYSTFGQNRILGFAPNHSGINTRYIGTMPNRDIELIYTYEPDRNIKYNFEVSYQTAGGEVLAFPKVSQLSITEADQNKLKAPLLSDIQNPAAVDEHGVMQPKYQYVRMELLSANSEENPLYRYDGTNYVPATNQTVKLSNNFDFTGNLYAKRKALPDAGGVGTLNTDNVTRMGAETTLTGKNGVVMPFQMNFMPNQAVRVRYIYDRNPNYPSTVKVQFRPYDAQDMRFAALLAQQEAVITERASAILPQTVTLPYVPNYRLAKTGVNPILDYDTAAFEHAPSVAAEPTAAPGSLTFKQREGGGTVIVYYEADPTKIVKINLSHSSGGSISGILSLPAVAASSAADGGTNYVISDLVDPARITPNLHYRSKGWFMANSTGTGKANPNDAPITNLHVISNGTSTPGIYRLYHEFEKDPQYWHSIHFTSGANGSISGNLNPPEVEEGSLLSAIAPVPTPDSGYRFEGWRDSLGNLIGDHTGFGPTQASADQTYTASFVLSDPDDGLYPIPDASAVIAANGTATVRINHPNPQRNYVLVDGAGNVIALNSGFNLQTQSFTGLAPGQRYAVYELASAASPAVGTSFIPPALSSEPAQLSIPPVNNNVSAQTAPSGSSVITIAPAAANVEYALADAQGNIVSDFASAISSSLVITGLEANRAYTIVARPLGSMQPAADLIREGLGREIQTPDILSAVSPSRLGIKVIQTSGKVNGFTGASGQRINDQQVQGLNTGDLVSITAASVQGSDAFMRWRLLSGKLNGFTASARSQSSLSIAQSSVLEPIYAHMPASPSNAVSVSYIPQDGSFGIDQNTLHTMRDNMVNHILDLSVTEDVQAKAAGKKIEYMITLDKHAVDAQTESDVRAASPYGDESSMELPWKMSIGLKRNVAGINKPVPSAYDQAFVGDIYAYVDRSLLSHAEYRVYKRDRFGAISEASVSNMHAEDFDGSFVIHGASVGDSYILTYHKTVGLTSYDARNSANQNTFILRGNSIPNENAAFGGYGFDFTQNTDNGRYVFKGWSTAAGSYTAFDTGADRVSADQSIFAYYIENPDWLDARSRLNGRITQAQVLRTDARMTAEQRSRLDAAIAAATAIYNKTAPSPSIAEMDAENAALEALMNALQNEWQPAAPPVAPPAIQPPGPAGPSYPVPNPHAGGGSGSGGGSSSSSGGAAVRAVQSFSGGSRSELITVGKDGDWNLVDGSQHIWEFKTPDADKLRNRWATIQYTYNGQTKVDTYHFNEQGVMDSGWFKDTDGSWYFLSTDHNGFFGHMTKGWHHDPQDGKWYFMDQMNGKMQTGWFRDTDGKYYYFNPTAGSHTWHMDERSGKWTFSGVSERPLGSMFADEITPDGYRVDHTGAWIRETPTSAR